MICNYFDIAYLYLLLEGHGFVVDGDLFRRNELSVHMGDFHKGMPRHVGMSVSDDTYWSLPLVLAIHLLRQDVDTDEWRTMSETYWTTTGRGTVRRILDDCGLEGLRA